MNKYYSFISTLLLTLAISTPMEAAFFRSSCCAQKEQTPPGTPSAPPCTPVSSSEMIAYPQALNLGQVFRISPSLSGRSPLPSRVILETPQYSPSFGRLPRQRYHSRSMSDFSLTPPAVPWNQPQQAGEAQDAAEEQKFPEVERRHPFDAGARSRSGLRLLVARDPEAGLLKRYASKDEHLVHAANERIQRLNTFLIENPDTQIETVAQELAQLYNLTNTLPFDRRRFAGPVRAIKFMSKTGIVTTVPEIQTAAPEHVHGVPLNPPSDQNFLV